MKRNIWDILAWIALGIVLFYLILKAVGVLQSPAVADVIAILSAGYFIGETVKSIKDGLHEIKEDVDDLRDKLISHNGRLRKLERK